MKVIICVDQDNGILFNHRRVSRDRRVIEQIEAENEEIWMSPYSKKMFENDEGAKISEDLADKPIVFLEEDIPKDWVIDELILYRFYELYPSDIKLTFDLKKMDLKNVTTLEGYSHPRIDKEEYVR